MNGIHSFPVLSITPVLFLLWHARMSCVKKVYYARRRDFRTRQALHLKHIEAFIQYASNSLWFDMRHILCPYLWTSGFLAWYWCAHLEYNVSFCDFSGTHFWLGQALLILIFNLYWLDTCFHVPTEASLGLFKCNKLYTAYPCTKGPFSTKHDLKEQFYYLHGALIEQFILLVWSLVP